MQKLINVLAITSFAVSAAVVGACGYVYVNQDAIVDSIKDQATGMITDAVGGAVGDLPNLLDGGSAPTPGSSAGVGLPMPF
jgi:hypothetical protein